MNIFSHNGTLYSLIENYGHHILRSEHGEEKIINFCSFKSVRETIETIEENREIEKLKQQKELEQQMVEDVCRLKSGEHKNADIFEAAINRYFDWKRLKNRD